MGDVLRRAAEAFGPEPGLMAAQPLLDLEYVLYNTLGAARRPRSGVPLLARAPLLR